jgi:hypothetical protein
VQEGLLQEARQVQEEEEQQPQAAELCRGVEPSLPAAATHYSAAFCVFTAVIIRVFCFQP